MVNNLAIAYPLNTHDLIMNLLADMCKESLSLLSPLLGICHLPGGDIRPHINGNARSGIWLLGKRAPPLSTECRTPLALQELSNGSDV